MKIISFVVFGKDSVYTLGAVENARLIEYIYPGWIGRFYVGDDVPDTVVNQLMDTPHQVVRFSVADYPRRAAQILRFFPASEVGVDAFIVRDTDSRINPREAAAVAQWLEHPHAQFHLMHEAMHNDQYGEIMGGMWGARVITKGKEPNLDETARAAETQVPCAGLIEAANAFLSQEDEAGGCYGDDMKFLSRYIGPLISEHNTVHHIDGDLDRQLGNLDVSCRCPFPKTSYQGFVGQPVRCNCDMAMFISTGCPHVDQSIPQGIASLVGSNAEVLASLSQFLS